jgi:hypothetical protein
MQLLQEQLLTAYESARSGGACAVAPGLQFRDVLYWLSERQNKGADLKPAMLGRISSLHQQQSRTSCQSCDAFGKGLRMSLLAQVLPNAFRQSARRGPQMLVRCWLASKCRIAREYVHDRAAHACRGAGGAAGVLEAPAGVRAAPPQPAPGLPPSGARRARRGRNSSPGAASWTGDAAQQCGECRWCISFHGTACCMAGESLQTQADFFPGLLVLHAVCCWRS